MKVIENLFVSIDKPGTYQVINHCAIFCGKPSIVS